MQIQTFALRKSLKLVGAETVAAASAQFSLLSIQLTDSMNPQPVEASMLDAERHTDGATRVVILAIRQ